MKIGCLLGFLKKRGMSSYSSPIMLIPRTLGGILEIVTDFRHLNSRLVNLKPIIHLIKDATQVLRASEAEALSLADFKYAYHTPPLAKISQQDCGIIPYYDSSTYIH